MDAPGWRLRAALALVLCCGRSLIVGNPARVPGNNTAASSTRDAVTFLPRTGPLGDLPEGRDAPLLTVAPVTASPAWREVAGGRKRASSLAELLHRSLLHKDFLGEGVGLAEQGLKNEGEVFSGETRMGHDKPYDDDIMTTAVATSILTTMATTQTSKGRAFMAGHKTLTSPQPPVATTVAFSPGVVAFRGRKQEEQMITGTMEVPNNSAHTMAPNTASASSTRPFLDLLDSSQLGRQPLKPTATLLKSAPSEMPNHPVSEFGAVSDVSKEVVGVVGPEQQPSPVYGDKGGAAEHFEPDSRSLPDTTGIGSPNDEVFTRVGSVGVDGTMTTSTTETDEETTTTTIVTTTIITTVQTPVPCNLSFSGPDGYLDSPEVPGFPYFSNLDCTYTVSVYPGYGVELQVKTLSLSEGEALSVYSILDGRPLVLSNQSLLVEGQVIRSPTNQVSVHFQSYQEGATGSFQFYYQEYLLSCPLPGKPAFGEVYVSGLHPGGKAYFHCMAGYQLRGQSILTCINSTHPGWDGTEPLCYAVCGGTVRNASVGRILSPNFPANYTNNLTCFWLIEAPPGHRVHLHFEKLALADDDDRLVVRNGNSSRTLPLYDSYETDYFPSEGIAGTGRALRLELTTDGTRTAAGFAVRYEAFEQGRCYEPYIQHGNFTTTDSSFAVGAFVSFSCYAGYTLEQGTSTSECLDTREPYWNQTEPVCRALCGGELSSSHGVILSPNYPGTYKEGQDCIWGIRVEDGRRMLLEIQLLDISSMDSLTIYDGDDLTARILGQYAGVHHRFRAYSTASEVTLQFLTDPARVTARRGRGFMINFSEVARNDTCPPLPDVARGWKTLSHPELVRGTMATYQCEPGFDILGTDILMCQWDLSWSTEPPTCQRVQYCTDPGVAEHGRRIISDSRFLVGATVQYACDRGYLMEGASLLTCHARDTGTPKWSAPQPRCIPEVFEPCVNPGVPENGYQLLYKRLYQPGELLRFSCFDGYQLVGDVSMRCLPGHPSRWSGTKPRCQEAYMEQHPESQAEVAKTTASGSKRSSRDVVMAITIPVVIIGFLIGGIYIYITKLRGKSTLRVPLTHSHSYARLPEEALFDNPVYEVGDTREYEVSI
uniref:seizure protein 6 homolog isoform X1 n=1 Tax=Myxine glutinosa TaxID=7769 RepID=UPI00358F7FE7